MRPGAPSRRRPPLIRSTALILAFASCAGSLCGAHRSEAGSFDTSSTACLATDGSTLDHVPDCMRVGRHVRVGPSISRGTAALRDGAMRTGLPGDETATAQRGRVRVQSGATWSGFFAR